MLACTVQSINQQRRRARERAPRGFHPAVRGAVGWACPRGGPATKGGGPGPSKTPSCCRCRSARLQVALQDELDAALEEGDQGRVDALLQRRPEDPQELFERAIGMAAGWGSPAAGSAEAGGGGAAAGCDSAGASAGQGQQGGAGAEAEDGAPGPMGGGLGGPHDAAGAAAAESSRADGGAEAGPAAASAAKVPDAAAPPAAGPAGGLLAALEGGAADPGWQWYPFSVLAGYLARRAEYLAKCAAAFPADALRYSAAALGAFREALAWAAAGGGVLVKYRFSPTGAFMVARVLCCAVLAEQGACGPMPVPWQAR